MTLAEHSLRFVHKMLGLNAEQGFFSSKLIENAATLFQQIRFRTWSLDSTVASYGAILEQNGKILQKQQRKHGIE
jgi:hypothetical protein